MRAEALRLARIAAVGALAAALAFLYLRGQAPDFTVFHAATGHAFGPVYDSGFISPLQEGVSEPRPWGYPPTFLLMLLWMGPLPLKAAYVLWVALGAVLVVEAAALRAPRTAVLVLLSPLVFLPMAMGQSTLVMAALLTAGLIVRRPLPAGVMLGVATCIKPQLMVFAFIGLAIAREWRTLGVAVATGAALVLASMAVFGPGKWLEWIGSMPGFLAFNTQLGVSHLVPDGQPVLKLALAAFGLGMVWLAFRQEDPVRRVIAAGGAALLASPHAVAYDLGLLAPAAWMVVTQKDLRAVPALWFLIGWQGWIGLAALMLLTWPRAPAFAELWPSGPAGRRRS